jgi:hypothetical protein
MKISYETHFVRAMSWTNLIQVKATELLKLLVEKSDLPEFDKILLLRYLNA